MVAASVLVLAGPGAVRHAWAQRGDQAIAFVKTTSGRLVAIVNSDASPADKRLRLKEVIDSSVDVDDIARFCLGRFWRIATPDQQSLYLPLFREMLVTEIAEHLGEYRGVQVTMGLARTSEDTEIVITMMSRPKNPTTQVDWVVSTSTGAPKIIDLLAGGTSMRLTQSADFSAYLSRHQYSVGDLIEAMRQQIAQGKP
jgi:phospholipid transport system substrate-binding protein